MLSSIVYYYKIIIISYSYLHVSKFTLSLNSSKINIFFFTSNGYSSKINIFRKYSNDELHKYVFNSNQLLMFLCITILFFNRTTTKFAYLKAIIFQKNFK